MDARPAEVAQNLSNGDGKFPLGSTVVRRDVLRGKVWTATPFRVIRDTGTELVIACWPGTEMMAPTTWIDWLNNGDDDVRKQAIPKLASGHWDLGKWVWRDTTLLTRYGAGEYYSVSRFFDGGDHSGAWYVDFVRPFERTRFGIDTFDLLLDLIVESDLSSYHWKDEDEYEEACRLGIISSSLRELVEVARKQVRELIGSREGPFAEDWSSWTRDESWPTPVLPADALKVGSRRE
jgi:protein associated with RNAse G/E